ncbi:oxygenase MpaB family protein [Nocardia salmonicida]|uniref:oxygenase MpaB family protein n=1 Tax=Nocardia salmonicida TaxID=53431 RepID=UPI0009FC783B|nr:oxygenase MpaB family protein [Nocardia salmonicida]
MTTTRFLNRDLAHSRFDPRLVRRLEQGLEEADSLADAVVASFGSSPQHSFRAVNAWLDGETGVPDSLATMLEPIAELPDWLDEDALERGSTALWRNGILWIGLSFNCAALAAGYQSGAGVKPLTFTGELNYRSRRRMQETGRWFLAATSPGALRRNGEGFRETVRVRFMHAGVRKRILQSGEWNQEAWGVPINLTDTAYGVSGEFSTIPLAAMRDAGVHFTERDLDDIQHMWRYIGYLLGVPDDLLPYNAARAREIIAIKDLTDTPADADSRQLVKALIENGFDPATVLPKSMIGIGTRPLVATLYALTRRWAGEDVADSLGLPNTSLKYLPTLLRPAVRAGEVARRWGLRDEQRLASRTRASFRELLDDARAPSTVAAEAVVQAAL